MKIAVIPNIMAAGVAAALPRVCSALEALGAEVLLPPRADAFPCAGTDGMLASCDLAVALGGDGTIIHTAKRAALAGRAVLGINCGRLGFMAGLEADELVQLSALIHGEYTVEKRMMLAVRVLTADGHARETVALNEAVVSRGSLSRMVELEVANRGVPVKTYRADGLIVATPTGSTAYSLSAGGPIADPAVNCLLLTPVCPHSLYSRAYIFPADAQLEIRAAAEGDRQVYLTVDGEEGISLAPEDTVCVSRAPIDASLITIKRRSFYDVLNDKLMNRR